MDVPEDRYILWEAEDKGLELPYACRMGCCTACAVKVKSGELFQYQALGVSRSLREEGYALMCVAFPLSDVELETVAEVGGAIHINVVVCAIRSVSCYVGVRWPSTQPRDRMPTLAVVSLGAGRGVRQAVRPHLRPVRAQQGRLQRPARRLCL